MSPAHSKKPLIPYLRQSRAKIEEQRCNIKKWAEANRLASAETRPYLPIW